MRVEVIATLFDYSYWANRQILVAAAELQSEELTAPARFTWRNLRDTLVFTLDVEGSWRRRLRGEPRERWDASLHPENYRTLADLSEEWDRDEHEMRTWIAGLDDAALAGIVDLGNGDRFPLWFYLLHLVTHSAHQRRDAALLLKSAGRDPPELDFLYYADHLHVD